MCEMEAIPNSYGWGKDEMHQHLQSAWTSSWRSLLSEKAASWLVFLENELMQEENNQKNLLGIQYLAFLHLLPFTALGLRINCM